ncbi:MAG: FAD-binding protein, partial [Rickettsiales bacterium]|nr:FAD-binding protein [Rickettsiales bacterium]
LRHISNNILEQKLPGIVELVKKFLNMDIRCDLIPVSPSAHYTMGGIPANENCQALNANNEVVEGLFVVGEAACLSVHGANRLGCNSLLDLVVFGKISGEKAALSLENERKMLKNEEIEQKIAKFSNIFDKNSKNSIKLVEIKIEIKENNEKYLGIFRRQDLLEEGLHRLLALSKKFDEYRINNSSLIFNEEIIDYFEVKSLLLNSIAANFSALNRKESRGAHYRVDFNKKNDDEFLSHSLVYKSRTINDLAFRLRALNYSAHTNE